MTRPIALSIPLATLALACTPPSSTETPLDVTATERSSLPTPVRPEPAAIAADHAVVVPQLQIASPAHWRLEPGGTHVAAKLGDACGVWQLGSGDYLGPAEDGTACETWAPLTPIAIGESPNEFSLRHPDGQRELRVAGDRFELSGANPMKGRVRGKHRYRAAVFSPEGARLALFVGDDQRSMQVEIWNVANARIERTLAFEANPDSLPLGHWLSWDDHSLVAIAHRRPPACDPAVDPDCQEEWYGPGWHDVHVVQIWHGLAAAPERIEMPSEGEQRIEQLFLDPQGRWLVGLLEIMQYRDGTTFSFEEVRLQGELETGLDWVANTLEEPTDRSAPLDADKLRQWNSVVGSTFLVIDEYVNSFEPMFLVGWSMTSMASQAIPEAPIELTTADGLLFETMGVDHAWRVVLAGRDVLLLTCQDRWLIAATPEPSSSVVLGQTRELARGSGEPRQIVWGPGGLALWVFSEGLRMFDAGGDELVATHASVIDLHRAVLDEELDLALVRERGGLRVADLRSAELGPVLAWTDRVEFAAFAPDRSQLAVAGAGEVAVFLRGESQPVARWRMGKLAGMAFRQDAQVLYVGATRPVPELALDPASGEHVDAARLDRVAFQRIDAAELDPSWRWAIEEDGTILRTIDGQAIDLIAGGGAISESGWFYGEPASFDEFRMRIGPDSPAPVYTFEAVADQLLRPNLLAEFFGGKPLPRPTLKAPQPPPPGS